MSKPVSNIAHTVEVALAERRYDILIGRGLLADVAPTLARVLPGARVGIVTDQTVAGLHLPAVEAALKAAGLHTGTVVLPPGEATKSFAQLAPLCEALLGMGLERGDAVLALGGGVIGDLAGFAASIVRRGIRFVQVPTTLLAQVDSSVGGKTGLNTPQGKNLIGAFHQPSLVIADIDVLATLSPRELRAGYAEVVKYGLLGDTAFFQWLEKHGPAVVAGDAAARTEAVRVSCVAKAGVVARDETETGERALLNLGHTFGHALEAWAGYSQRLLHGEAVAIGMALAFGLSEELGVCPAGTTKTVRAHLRRVGLPTRIAEVPSANDGMRPDVATLLSLMRQDKKVVAGKQTLILARGIGAAYITRDVPPDVLSDYLTRALAA
jgi:3-dehydroquinate synthase